VLVHEYFSQLLTKLCSEKQVRDQLWNVLLLDKLRSAYCRAMNHARFRFLLSIERGGRPTTFHHYSTQEIKIIASSKPMVVAKTENYNRPAVCAGPIVSLFLSALPLCHYIILRSHHTTLLRHNNASVTHCQSVKIIRWRGSTSLECSFLSTNALGAIRNIQNRIVLLILLFGFGHLSQNKTSYYICRSTHKV
jgi:hypothetical protein